MFVKYDMNDTIFSRPYTNGRAYATVEVCPSVDCDSAS